MIKVVTGARRCGKSYLLNTLFYRTLKENGIQDYQIIRFAFDNDEDLDKLDSFVGTLNGFWHHPNFDIYVTGSNSRMLSSDVETKFRGRKSTIHVLPLTFKELKEGLSLSSEEAWE